VSSVSPGAKKYVDIGRVTNNMVVDINKINFYVYFRPNLFVVPFILGIYFYMIYDEVGLIGLSAIGIVAICYIIQSVIDYLFKKANLDRMAISDTRGKRINEIITGIKIVKFNAWESILNKIVSKYRFNEGKEIWKTFTLFNLSQAVTSLIPTALGLTVFSLYKITEGKTLDVATIYKLVTLFNATLIPIRFYIMGIMGRADSLAASERMNKLVQIEPQES
jgi:ABC-type multidrug transport system fused ATPase/permease subunit